MWRCPVSEAFCNFELLLMDNSNITIDGFDPDALDNLSDPIEPVAQAAQARPAAVQPRAASDEPYRPDRIRHRRRATTPQPAVAAPAAARPSSQPEAAPARSSATRQPESAAPAAASVAAPEPLDLTVPLGWVRDGRLSKVVGACLVMVALYFFIVCVSFFRTGAADQSLAVAVQTGTVNAAAASAEADNIGRIFGALLSYNFIARWFGFGAFAIIYLFTALGLALMRLHRFNIFSVTAKSLMTTVAISVIAGYLSLHFVSTFHWGGSHGLCVNELVRDMGGEIGCLLLSVLMLLMVVIVFIQDVIAACRRCVAGYRSLREAVSRENHRRAMREAREEANRREEEAVRRAAPQPAAAPAKPAASAEAAVPSAAPAVAAAATVAAAVATVAPEASATAVTGAPAAAPSLFDIDDEEDTSDGRPEPIVMDPLAVESLRQPTPAPQAKPVAQAAPAPVQPRSEMPAPDPVVTPEVDELEDDDIIEDDIDDHLESPSLDDIDEPAHAVDIDEILDTPAEETPAEQAEQINPIAAAPVAAAAAAEGSMQPYDPTADLSHYRFPTLDLLHDRQSNPNTIDVAEQEENKQRLVATLASFGIGVSQINATIGPTVTLYEIVPSEGVRIARIKALENDLARAISAIGTRIIAPIPGRDTVGIEVPNKDPQTVAIRSILSSDAYRNCKMQLPMAMGVTIDNTVYLADLCKMPHLLVAGATGMGKSVGLNTIIASLLYKKHPAELKFVLVDPKMVEFSLYRRLENHYLAKLPDQDDAIITDPQQVIPTLNSLCYEMDQRYLLLKDAYVRNITEYNAKFRARRLNPEKGHRFLPYIVVVVDEFADLIMTAGKEVEQPIARIAQKARAVGIHLILATQRPSTNVITGIIKANFPGRIAFRVFQMVDSRTILDRPGANQLIGRGDMLFSRDGIVDRVQCAFIDTDEVDAICEAISSQQGYAGPYELPEVLPDGSAPGSGGGAVADMDPYFADAGRYVIGSNQGSTSAIQRHFNIGYPRAGKIMDQLEQAGVVGPVVGAKPRAVLMDLYAFESYLDTINQ